MIALVSLLLLQTPDLTRFKELVDRAEKSDAAIPAALDALSRAAFTPGFDSAAYQRAAGQPEFSTSIRRVQVLRAEKDGIVVVGVTLGDWSRVRIRNRAGVDLEVPKDLRLIQHYGASPVFIGSILVVIQPGIQDAGIRYGYRNAFLVRKGNAFQTAQNIAGLWTYGEEPSSHITMTGTRVTLRTIEPPRHFFTTSPERLFRADSTWDLSGAAPRLRSTQRFDPEMRAVDQWMGTALRAAKPTLAQTRFRKAWDTESPMLDGWRLAKTSNGSEIILDLSLRYRFRVSKQGLVSFLGVSKA